MQDQRQPVRHQYLTYAVLGILSLLFTYSGSSFAQQPTEPTYLRADKLVCTADAQSADPSTCSVHINWAHTTGNDACLFVSHDQSLLTCSNFGKMAFHGVRVNDVTTVELRTGTGSDYASLVQAETLNFIGLTEEAQTVSSAAVDQIKRNYFKNFSQSFVTSSWDGRLFFRHANSPTLGRHIVVKALNPGELTSTGGTVNLSDPGIFSASMPFASEVDLKIPPGNHLAVYPDPVFKDNPYQSTASGARSPLGQYKTYRMYGVIAAKKFFKSEAGNPNDLSDDVFDESQYLRVPQDRFGLYKYDDNGVKIPTDDMKSMLGRFKARITVSDPNAVPSSTTTSISSVQIYGPAAVLKHNNGQTTIGTDPDNTVLEPYIYGYEPSVTLDGGMIVYSGSVYPEIRKGTGGMITYVSSRNPVSNNAWSAPRNIADMYMADGPGGGQETLIRSKNFSDRYPLAKKPLLDFEGDTTSHLIGAYPWVSFDGSEVMFQSIPNFYGPERQGTMMVGARTGHILTHIDGDLNLTRGNVTDDFTHFQENFCTAVNVPLNCNSDNQWAALDAAYRALQIPGFDGADEIGGGFEQNLVAPIGLFGSSWSGFPAGQEAALPLSPNRNSYGFMMTGSGSGTANGTPARAPVAKYAEVSIIDNFDDLLVYYPMNEPVKTDSAAVQAYIAKFEAVKNGQDFGLISGLKTKEFNKYAISKTADYSKFHHTGHFSGFPDVEGGESLSQTPIGYPFEFYDARTTWETQGILKDVQEGFHGNSIFFRQGGAIETDLKTEAVDQLINSQAFTIAFWVNRGAGGTAAQSISPIVSLDNIFVGWMNSNRLSLKLYTSESPSGASHVVEVLTDGPESPWNHYAFTYDLGVLRTYVNGVKTSQVTISGLLETDAGPMTLKLGPGARLDTIDHLQMDEAYIYAKALTERDIQRLAWVKSQASSIPSTITGIGTQFEGLPQEYVDLNAFDASEQMAMQTLGANLFGSSALALNSSNMSCESCHLPGANAFADIDALSTGGIGIATRNTPTIANLLFGDTFFMDGRVDSLEEQVLHPIINPEELGFSADPEAVLSALSGFQTQFATIFGGSDPQPYEINFTDLSLTLSRYVRGLITAEVAEPSTSIVRQGKDIFDNVANCAACHSGPNFTDNEFHDIGRTPNEVEPGVFDLGKGGVTLRASDERKFKTPTLINISETAPYFHDGSAATLMEVVEHYEKGGDTDTHSPDVRVLDLGPNQLSALVAYLESLDAVIEEK